MPFVTVPEAAVRLGVSPQTVKRRVKSGKLSGRQEATAQGFNWLIDIPDMPNNPSAGTPSGAPDGIPNKYADMPRGFGDTPIGVPTGIPDGVVDIPGDIATEKPSIVERLVTLHSEVEGQRALIASLNDQIHTLKGQLGIKDQQLESKDRQVEQLHVLIQQLQHSLPSLRESRPWWRFWSRG
jgi:hypothetical protein